MDLAYRSPLVECFRQGGVPLDVRLAAARGSLSPQVHEQLYLLMVLASDAEPEVSTAARATIARLPAAPLAAYLASPDVTPEVREFYANPQPPPVVGDRVREPSLPCDVASEGDTGAASLAESVTEEAEAGDAPLASTAAGDSPAEIAADPERVGTAQRLSMMTVAERMKIAMQGTREERGILIRDPNRLVSSAVLSSPKLTESEVEGIARMTNVTDEVLRTVGTNRVWTKNYPVIAALARNPKTPVGIALTLLPRLIERDIKTLSTDRNVPEPIRLLARKIYSRGAARRQ